MIAYLKRNRNQVNEMKNDKEKARARLGMDSSFSVTTTIRGLHMRNALRITILLFCLCGCSEQTNEPLPTNPFDKWKKSTTHNYIMDQTYMCFCLNAGEAMRVTVRSDTIASVMRLSDSSMLPREQAARYLTIDSMFSIIRAPKGDSLVVSYDVKYGYPDTLDINPQQHPFDGGILYTTTNLKFQ